MADFDLTDKLGGQPKWVWIVGGVAIVSGIFWFRNRNQPQPAGETVGSSLAYGSAGGTGLAADQPYGTPATFTPPPKPYNDINAATKPVLKPYSNISAAGKPVLKRGATGTLVTTLQKELADNGLNVPATGLFDQQTYIAVKQYQTSRGLDRDGVVGTDTWAALTINKKAIVAHKEKVTKAKVKVPTVVKKATGRSTGNPKTDTPAKKKTTVKT